MRGSENLPRSWDQRAIPPCAKYPSLRKEQSCRNHETRHGERSFSWLNLNHTAAETLSFLVL